MLPSKARSLRVGGKIRGLIIAYGIGAFALIQHNLGAGHQRETAQPGQNALTLIVIGLALQGVRLLVLGLAARYERAHGVEGALSPTVLSTLDLVMDSITVLLFALATFRGMTGVIGDL